MTNTTISSFFPDDKVTIRMTSNAAFLYAQLVSISQSSNPVFGNFTSILKVDLSQLRQQHITLIRCGDSGTSKALPVDVQIYQLSIPLNPQMVKVYASFDSSEFVSLTVSWNLPVSVVSILFFIIILPCTCTYRMGCVLNISSIYCMRPL